MHYIEKNFYKIIFSDLDNTLLMPDKTLSPRTKEQISRLRKAGVSFVPSTGRAFWSIPKDVMECPDIRYAIVSNGAAIYDMQKKEPLKQYVLQEAFAAKLFEFLAGETLTYECFVKGQAYTSQGYFNDPADFGIPGDRERNYVQSTRIAVPDIKEFTLEHAGELDALDVIIVPEERDRVSAAIKEHFDGIYITTSVEHLIEISNEKSGKHQAMLAVMEELGIAQEASIAFGDGINDSEMLETAGLGIAVENADPACKAAADHVIGPFDQESVAKFLECL